MDHRNAEWQVQEGLPLIPFSQAVMEDLSHLPGAGVLTAIARLAGPDKTADDQTTYNDSPGSQYNDSPPRQ